MTSDTQTQSQEALLRENPQYIVVFNAPAPDNEAALAHVLQVDAVPQAEARASRTVLQSRHGVHARVYRRLAVAAANLTPDQVAALEELPNVRGVARNQRRRLPPVYPVAVAATAGWNPTLDQIGLSATYEGPTGKGVKVAVLDTGCGPHPDIHVPIGNTKSFVPSEPDTDDQNGHGTHCAGVVAGRVPGGGAPRYGVAPDAELIIAKVLDATGSGYDDQILDAIDWAVDLGAEIVSLSLGSRRLPNQPFSAAYETVASALLAQGVLLVAAAGNESLRPSYVAPVGNPAACPSILAVAAVDGRDQVAPFSCGAVDPVAQVDLAAPGVGVFSAWPGATYRRLSGTSMATPHVAGIAALFRERFPGVSGAALWQSLTNGARSVPATTSDVGAGVARVP